MEEPGFAELEQAAVAGAEGTAWVMPDLSSDDTASLVHDPCYSAALSATSPFDAFATSPTSVKQEPCFLALQPASPPEQASLCSLSSEEAFVNVARNVAVAVSAVNTPVESCISKQRRRVSSMRVVKVVEPCLSKDEMADLKGTTAARSRKMTEEERRIMLHKRRLRNRASAARSREKRSRTLNDLSTEVEDLMKKAVVLAEQAKEAVEEANRLRAKNVMLVKQNELLRAELNLE